MTPNLILETFSPSHLARMSYTRPEMSSIPAVAFGEIEEYGRRLAAWGPAYTLLAPTGDLISSAGIGLLWPGVGEGWVIMSDLADHYMFSVHAVVKRIMIHLLRELHLHRLQITVPSGSDRARSWAHRLGFAWEGDMRGYGPDRATYQRFAMVI